MNGPVPASLYLTISPDSLETYKPYLRLFLNLLINRNVGPLSFGADARPIKSYVWKLGMILDEFTSTLGELTIFATQLAFIAGYGIKPAIIVQDEQQLIGNVWPVPECDLKFAHHDLQCHEQYDDRRASL